MFALNQHYFYYYRYYSANRAALQLRASLLPYIYNAAREAFDVSSCRLRPLTFVVSSFFFFFFFFFTLSVRLGPCPWHVF
jgi:hypothetical protein